jgi:putative Ca2+/H+ antiporter (TMEM165/GDT1 family)
VAASVAFSLAELGDKTMLATITLATTEGAFGTWADLPSGWWLPTRSPSWWASS